MLSYDANLEKISLKKFTEKSYLDYAMYVILDRALPFIGDGMKPVQRRIVYAMSELGLSHGAKFKKSARTVGDVIGKFHPHGDSAAYEAMVLMAQPFSYRYPLVDGQGNWGSVDDPKSFAAMRYTESRLTGYAETLLSELGMGTVGWQPNFDGTMNEPVRLPARLPNILLNGGSGIAVGMSTDIPPHNLKEVAKACSFLLDHPNAGNYELCRFIKAPDFPGGAEIITSVSDVRKIYRTGMGVIKMRAPWHREDGMIVINELPLQVSGSKVLEQIAREIRDNKLFMIQDARDESDHEHPIRLVIVPRSNRVDPDKLMSHLYAATDLEKNIRVNLNMIGLDGKPRVKNLHTILTEWLQFRTGVVRKRLDNRLKKVTERLRVLDGFLIAYLNIDEVIRIVRTEDYPQKSLMTRFNISEVQANAVLDLRLRQLAKLEEIKILAEQKKLAQEQSELEGLLGSEEKLKNLIKNELAADAKIYGDNRRTKLVERAPAVLLDIRDFMPSEPVSIVLSTHGWIRAGKGHDIDPAGLSYRSGDEFLTMAYGKSSQKSVVIDNTGRVYSLENNSLPSLRGHGEPLTGKIDPPPGASFIDVISGGDEDEYMIATGAGYGFRCRLENMYSRGRAGKTFLKVQAGFEVLGFARINDSENDLVAAASSTGRLLIFPVAELPELARGKGNKIIGIPPKALKTGEETMSAYTVFAPDDGLKIISGKRYLKLTGADMDNFKVERGKRGGLLPAGFRNVSKIIVEKMITDPNGLIP